MLPIACGAIPPDSRSIRHRARLPQHPRASVAAIFGALALTLGALKASAAIIDSGIINTPVNATIDGVYINFVTGATATSAAGAPGWDFNPFASTGPVLAFFTSAANASVTGSGTTLSEVLPGGVVGPATSFATVGSRSTAGTVFRTTGTYYIGVRFMNEATGINNYGYVQISTSASSGFPATVVRYVYENTGQAVTVPGSINFRSYLSPQGNDANPCTLAQPCRLLPAALATTTDGGEVWMLGSANYNTGPVTISRGVSIVAVPGVIGSLVASGGDAVVVSAAARKVALRNLVVVPLPGGGGIHGISIFAAQSVDIEGCSIANLPGNGIIANGVVNVTVSDSTVRDNGGSGIALTAGAKGVVTRSKVNGNAASGVHVLGSVASTTSAGDVFDSVLEGNGTGFYVASSLANAPAEGSIQNSQVVRNFGNGVVAESALAVSRVTVSRNQISNNGTGVRAMQPQGRVWARGNAVSNNGVGFENSSGTFESAGDNTLDMNAIPTSGSIALIPRL